MECPGNGNIEQLGVLLAVAVPLFIRFPENDGIKFKALCQSYWENHRSIMELPGPGAALGVVTMGLPGPGAALGAAATGLIIAFGLCL